MVASNSNSKSEKNPTVETEQAPILAEAEQIVESAVPTTLKERILGLATKQNVAYAVGSIAALVLTAIIARKRLSSDDESEDEPNVVLYPVDDEDDVA